MNKLVDNRARVTFTESSKGFKVVVLLDQEPTGDGHGCRARQTLASQQNLNDCAPRAAIAVGERMDCLELSMRDRDLRQQQKVVPGSEADQVVDRSRNQPVGRSAGHGWRASALHSQLKTDPVLLTLWAADLGPMLWLGLDVEESVPEAGRQKSS